MHSMAQLLSQNKFFLHAMSDIKGVLLIQDNSFLEGKQFYHLPSKIEKKILIKVIKNIEASVNPTKPVFENPCF